MTEKSQVVEQARIDIMEIIAEKRGEDPTEKEIKDIIEMYFTTVPESLEDLTQDITTKSGGYNVKLEEVLNGVTIKETYISKSTEKADSYVGYYADIDNDGKVDGIIYADMIVGNTKSGRWNNDGYSVYDVTKIEDVTTVKDYVVSSKIYEGQTIAGRYKANDGFGEKEVLVPARNSTGTEDRFYIMSLENFKTADYETFYWYYNALGKLDRGIAKSTIDFGEGKENTIKMLNDWNNNTATYGAQTIASSGKARIDLWGAIQDNQYELVQTAQDSKKWFVPSKSEWCAFGEELEIKTRGYAICGLGGWYWSSSQGKSVYGYHFGYLANFYNGGMSCDYNSVNVVCAVRLSATF